jgi:hypothetical protein
MQDICSLQRAKEGCLFIAKAPTGITAILTATIFVPMPSGGSVSTVAGNDHLLTIQGGIPLAVHGVLTHNGDKLKRGRIEGKNYFQFIFSKSRNPN